MQELPFEIPKSLQSFCEQYDKKPDRTIDRLQKQVQKNRADAVTFFLLGWFYYQEGSQQKAVDCALKAKMLAPGSPFFNKLHYFFSHPELFNAWNKVNRVDELLTTNDPTPSVSALNLDSLIEKLSDVESIRMKPGQEYEPQAVNAVSYSVDEADDIASETLAKVHEQQGNYNAAVAVYQKLKLLKKDKTGYFDEKIARLIEERQSKEENRD